MPAHPAHRRDVARLSPGLLAAGDLLVVHGAGAYGYVMSSNYNARPRAAEVMVDGHRFAVVTARESYDDLMRLELVDPDWRDA